MQLAFYMQVHLMDFNESNDLKKVEDINTTFLPFRILHELGM